MASFQIIVRNDIAFGLPFTYSGLDGNGIGRVVTAAAGGNDSVAVDLALLARAEIDTHCAIDGVVLHDHAARTPDQEAISDIPLKNQISKQRGVPLIDNPAPDNPRAEDVRILG